MNGLITDVDADQQAKLEEHGFGFVTMSWGRSVWAHPEYKGSFYPDEAFAAIDGLVPDWKKR